MAFEFKNIQTETLGEYLQTVRKQQNLSLKEVANAANVPIKFVQALEEGNFIGLPAKVYVVGFLKKISSVYGAPSDVVIAQFKKEHKILELTQTKPTAPQRNRLPNFAITPKLLSLIIGLGLVIAIVGWLIWQVASINTSPSLEIEEPKASSVIKESVVRVKGKTDPGSNLTINKENVFVDKDGMFNAVLSISSGQKILVFESTNKFDKKTVKTIAVVVDLPVVIDPDQPKAEEALILEISVKKDLSISLTIDDILQPTETIVVDKPKQVRARKKIQVLTPDAGNTFVTLNGKALGALGRVGETLTVPFSK